MFKDLIVSPVVTSFLFVYHRQSFPNLGPFILQHKYKANLEPMSFIKLIKYSYLPVRA